MQRIVKTSKGQDNKVVTMNTNNGACLLPSNRKELYSQKTQDPVHQPTDGKRQRRNRDLEERERAGRQKGTHRESGFSYNALHCNARIEVITNGLI